jgi:F420-non-reducing hydrogenase small subunit
MYIATVALSACGGCENSLLSVGEPLVALLNEDTISFSSILVDRRTVSPSDVVLASGCIRNSEEREVAAEIARMSRKVIAVGTCAVYGGVCGLAKAADSIEAPEEGVLPQVFKAGEPLDTSMAVELYVPGCPPPPNLIFEALKSVVEGYSPVHLNTTVCSDCPRAVARKSAKSLQSHPGPGITGSSCLLNAGLLCMGPVTRGGCCAACPTNAVACAGCRGPSDTVLSSQLHSVYSDMVAYVSRTTGAREDKVVKQLEPMLRVLYSFTRGDPVTRARVKERVPGD